MERNTKGGTTVINVRFQKRSKTQTTEVAGKKKEVKAGLKKNGRAQCVMGGGRVIE